MAREPSPTRIALMRSAEEWFARDGIDGARVSDILKTAGQANDSAINYYFGSRWGLVQEIVDTHVIDTERFRTVSTGPLKKVVASLVEPFAQCLLDESGRNFLRIANQIIDRATGQAALPPGVMKGPLLAEQTRALDHQLEGLSPAMRTERTSAFVVLAAGVLALRARQLDAGSAVLSHEEFVANLVDMLTAALRS